MGMGEQKVDRSGRSIKTVVKSQVKKKKKPEYYGSDSQQGILDELLPIEPPKKLIE